MGFGVVGLEFQGCAELRYGLVEPAAAEQGRAEVVVGLGIAGLKFQHLLSCRTASSNWRRRKKALPNSAQSCGELGSRAAASR